MKAAQLTGMKFGRLTVIQRAHSTKEGRHWDCVCDCGVAVCVPTKKLNNGNTKSCGCLNSDLTAERNRNNATHGMTKSPEWIVWDMMKQRCLNPNHKSYEHYKHVTICNRWLDSFENFYEDMGPRPVGKTLDRKNNDGDYEPGNCRWATPFQQSNNRNNNVTLTLRGVTMTCGEWSRELGIGQKTILYRRKQGWTDEQVLTTSVSHTNRGPKI